MVANNLTPSAPAESSAKRYHSPAEVAQITGLHRLTVYRRIESKQWPCVRVGNRVLISAAWLNQFLAQGGEIQ